MPPNVCQPRNRHFVSMLADNLISRDCHPIMQFFKFAVCGVMSTAVHMLVFYSFAASSFLPALDNSIINGELISDGIRARNSLIINCYAFIIANIVGYLLNILCVFEPGRHKPIVEFGLFLAVSFVGFAIGLLGGPLFIHLFSISTHLSQALLVITTTLINYSCRKYLVFK